MKWEGEEEGLERMERDKQTEKEKEEDLWELVVFYHHSRVNRVNVVYLFWQ